MTVHSQIAKAEIMVKRAGYISPDVGNIIGSRMAIRKALIAWGPDELGDVINPTIVVGILEGENSTELEISDTIGLLQSKYGKIETYVMTAEAIWTRVPGNRVVEVPEVTSVVETHEPWTVVNPGLVEKILRTHGQVKIADADPSRKLDLHFESLEKFKNLSVVTFEGQEIVISQGILYAVWQSLARDLAIKASGGHAWALPLEVSGAMAHLGMAGGYRPKTVLDPFMKSGEQLVQVVSRVPGISKLFGFELDQRLFRVSQVFLNSGNSYGMWDVTLTPENMTLANVDPFITEWPKVDLVVASSPWGTKLSEPCLAPSLVTRDAEVAAIDKACSALNPGGRLVICTTRGWTFRGNDSAKLRNSLISNPNLNVKAVIGLPRISPLTSVEFCLVVIEKAPGGETFVTELGADWAEQLKPGSQLMQELEVAW